MSLVAVDIGGTNVRFAVAGRDNAIECFTAMECADHASLADAFAAFADAHGVSATSICVAVAGPVAGDSVNITNSNWRFSQKALPDILGVERVLVINDFTAQAFAQTGVLAKSNIEVLGGNAIDGAPLLVIGPGTGLGVSALVPVRDGVMAIEGEGGHVALSPVGDVEHALLRHLAAKASHVSAEQVVSGPGLEAVYGFLSRGGSMSAPRIGEAALAGERIARDCVHVMLGVLGTAMADAVLLMGCWRGAVIAGGITAHLAPLLASSPFAARFRRAGAMSHLLEEVPVWLCTDPMAGLAGAIAAFSSPQFQDRIITAER